MRLLSHHIGPNPENRAAWPSEPSPRPPPAALCQLLRLCGVHRRSCRQVRQKPRRTPSWCGTREPIRVMEPAHFPPRKSHGHQRARDRAGRRAPVSPRMDSRAGPRVPRCPRHLRLKRALFASLKSGIQHSGKGSPPDGLIGQHIRALISTKTKCINVDVLQLRLHRLQKRSMPLAGSQSCTSPHYYGLHRHARYRRTMKSRR